jgi:hypothetical protein
MAAKQPFSPKYGSNQVVTPAAASATINIDATCKNVRVVNSGAAKGYFRIFKTADGALTASVADFCVLPNMSSVVTKADGQDKLAHISATGTTFEVMTGEGW